MTRMVKDYVELGDQLSLDSLIARLVELRDGLPCPAEAELKLRGDDVYGRHLCISFLRPLTPEEAACEGRYADVTDGTLKAAA
jgi:hypothetical protein